MIKIRVDVQQSEESGDTLWLADVTLLGVPRIGETLIAENAEFTVVAVTWEEGLVSITVKSDRYKRFPIPDRQRNK